MYDGAPAHFNTNTEDVPNSYSCKPVGPSEGHSFLEKCWNAEQAWTTIWHILGIFQHLWNSWYCRSLLCVQSNGEHLQQHMYAASVV